MTKVRLAVWGITDPIWESIKNEIDPRRAEIIYFIDSNADKIGGYASRPIYCYDAMDMKLLYEVDYILVTAYSGYRQIRKKLIHGGYPREKIQLYISPGIKMYNLGDLSEESKRFIDVIYFEPRKRWSELLTYIATYAKYTKCECLKEHTGRWYEKGTLISHACGGVVNGRKVMYSNSKEALEYSFSKGFRLIECDVLGFEQSEVILAHDFDKLYEAEELRYTIQNFDEMLTTLKKYPKTSMLVDVKWNVIEEYDFYISYIIDSICRIAKDEQEKKQLYKQIVMEVYDEASIQSAQKAGFDVFFTQYRNPNIKDFMNTVKICSEYEVGVVGYGAAFIREYRKAIPILKEKNIKIYVYSTNSKDEYVLLRELGVDGIFTDWLTYEDVAAL